MGAGNRLAGLEMSDDVREIVAREALEGLERYWPQGLVSWEEQGAYAQDRWREISAAILAALDEAGYRFAGPDEVVVERGRFERVRKCCAEDEAWWRLFNEGEEYQTRPCPTQPGDLDPLPEATP